MEIPLRLANLISSSCCVVLLLAGCGNSADNAGVSSMRGPAADKAGAKGGGDRGRGGPPGRGPGGSSPTLVVTQPASMRIVRDEVEAIGTSTANESVILTAQVTDTVNQVKFDDGDFVAMGDVLVVLTNDEETALLAESEADLNDARRQHTRFANLLEDGSVPVSEVDEAKARLAATEARYKSVVARLDDRLIRAPFAGTLGFREVSPGTLVTPGAEITTLDDISVIKLDFSIPELYLSLVEPGMSLVAESSAFPGTTFDATVTTIRSRIDPITRAATVRAHIDNPELILRPGMLLTVHLTTAEREVLMVPEIALMQRASRAFVYTISDGRAELVEVTHGKRDQGWVEILSGLDEGQRVISEGVIKIRNGSTVTTQTTDTPDAMATQERSGAGNPGR